MYFLKKSPSLFEIRGFRFWYFRPICHVLFHSHETIIFQLFLFIFLVYLFPIPSSFPPSEVLSFSGHQEMYWQQLSTPHTSSTAGAFQKCSLSTHFSSLLFCGAHVSFFCFPYLITLYAIPSSVSAEWGPVLENISGKSALRIHRLPGPLDLPRTLFHHQLFDWTKCLSTWVVVLGLGHCPIQSIAVECLVCVFLRLPGPHIIHTNSNPMHILQFTNLPLSVSLAFRRCLLLTPGVRDVCGCPSVSGCYLAVLSDFHVRILKPVEWSPSS